MALSDNVLTLVALLQIDFPAATVRLCDGGFVDFLGNRFESSHSIFGTVGGVGAVDEAMGDEAAGGSFVLLPNPAAALGDKFNANFQNSRVQMWLGELQSDGVTVDPTAEKLFDGFVDYPVWRPATGQLELFYVSYGEKLFFRNEGNVLAGPYHKSIWAGELGLDNATDATISVPWGIEASPRGTLGGSGSGGGFGGGGGGGRSPFGVNAV